MNLTNFFEKAFNTLIRASVDKKSDARNVVVSISDGEYPSSRVMVLREVNVEDKSFIFFSDSNAEKCKLIGANPRGSLTVWDKKNNLQIRIRGKFVFDPDIVGYWNRLGDLAKKSYGNQPFPSMPIPERWEYDNKPEISSFTVLKFLANKFDILCLGKEKHFRAVYESRDSWKGCWVVP